VYHQDEVKKKRNKREKVKPILHNKEEHSPLAENVDELPPANHFDETHPKDDVLLKRSHSVRMYLLSLEIHVLTLCSTAGRHQWSRGGCY
jgi:hypothetical protein